MLDANTAPPKRSIWAGIDPKKFELYSQYLDDRKHVAGPRDYSGATHAHDERAFPFSFEVERQLADDFAFIAAYIPEPRRVSAAAVEYDDANSQLTIRLAANEGIDNKVAKTFDKLIGILKKCARRGQSGHFTWSLFADLTVDAQRFAGAIVKRGLYN